MKLLYATAYWRKLKQRLKEEGNETVKKCHALKLRAADGKMRMQDPELSIEQAVADYRRLGYSGNRINQRLKSIEVRKLLTDEWKRGGVQGQQYASLTDIITNTTN